MNTSSRDLSSAMNLNPGGMYYYFASKDDLIIECANLAAIKLENELILFARDEIKNPTVMFEMFFEKSEQMAPYMQFLIQVCSDRNYKIKMDSMLSSLSSRYTMYSNKFAKEIGIDQTIMEQCLCVSITAMTNYMIFGEKRYVMPQIKMVVSMLDEALRERGIKNE